MTPNSCNDEFIKCAEGFYDKELSRLVIHMLESKDRLVYPAHLKRTTRKGRAFVPYLFNAEYG